MTHPACQVCESEEVLTSGSRMGFICERCRKELTLAAVRAGRKFPTPTEAMELRAELKQTKGPHGENQWGAGRPVEWGPA